jgi:hypothetical protein
MRAQDRSSSCGILKRDRARRTQKSIVFGTVDRKKCRVLQRGRGAPRSNIRDFCIKKSCSPANDNNPLRLLAGDSIRQASSAEPANVTTSWVDAARACHALGDADFRVSLAALKTKVSHSRGQLQVPVLLFDSTSTRSFHHHLHRSWLSH